MNKYDIQLQPNFNLQEAIFWAEHLDMSNREKELAITTAIESLNFRTLANIAYQAARLQDLRNKLNQIYSEHNVWIRVSSWLRGEKWERYKGRDGTSQHTTGLATDIQIVGLPREHQAKAYEFAMGYFTTLPGWTKRYEWGLHNDSRNAITDGA